MVMVLMMVMVVMVMMIIMVVMGRREQIVTLERLKLICSPAFSQEI